MIWPFRKKPPQPCADCRRRESQIRFRITRTEKRGRELLDKTLSDRLLCPACLGHQMDEAFYMFQGQGVVTQPLAGKSWSSYQGYRVGDLKDWGFSGQDAALIASLLPPADGRCKQCQKIASFNWVGHSLYKSSQKGGFGGFKAPRPDEVKTYCGRCAARHLMGYFRRLGPTLNDVALPASGNLLFLSWE
ncbi:MAG: hypothetical protein HYS41_02245 [Candidatus Omnitrophica bacterium]|nr:hypothetical protein [Candidatus Omnitrophota bacterium]